MAFRQIQASNAEVETYIKRLSSYSLAFENCAARLRKTRTPEQIKVVHNRALAEWQDKANGFPSQYVPKAGTPEWHAMWKKLNNIFTSTPKTDRELSLTCIAGIFAMSALIDHDLADHPSRLPIRLEAERRTLSLMDQEDDPVTVEQPAYIGLAGRNIPGVDFTITDYGTSLSKGPWVEYLPRNGVKGKDELTVTGDEMEMMLESRNNNV